MRLSCLFILIFLVSSLHVKAQKDWAITPSGNEFANKLIAEKVDTFVTYNYPDYRSEPWDHVYVIWKKEGKTSIYNDYSKDIQIMSEGAAADIWGFLDTNLVIMKKEKVKPFSSMIKVKGKNVVETIPTMDSQWWKSWIYMKGEVMAISEGESPFMEMEKYNDGKVKTNINYAYNSKLKLKLFLDKLDLAVSHD